MKRYVKVADHGSQNEQARKLKKKPLNEKFIRKPEETGGYLWGGSKRRKVSSYKGVRIRKEILWSESNDS